MSATITKKFLLGRSKGSFLGYEAVVLLEPVNDIRRPCLKTQDNEPWSFLDMQKVLRI
jgi:hypothetical protein